MGTVRVNLPIVFINFEAEFICLFNTTFIVTELSEMHGAGRDKVRSEYYISTPFEIIRKTRGILMLSGCIN